MEENWGPNQSSTNRGLLRIEREFGDQNTQGLPVDQSEAEKIAKRRHVSDEDEANHKRVRHTDGGASSRAVVRTTGAANTGRGVWVTSGAAAVGTTGKGHTQVDEPYCGYMRH